MTLQTHITCKEKQMFVGPVQILQHSCGYEDFESHAYWGTLCFSGMCGSSLLFNDSAYLQIRIDHRDVWLWEGKKRHEISLAKWSRSGKRSSLLLPSSAWSRVLVSSKLALFVGHCVDPNKRSDPYIIKGQTDDCNLAFLYLRWLCPH